MDFHVSPSAVGTANVNVPGDKSISHRALMLGSLADGTSRIRGFLAGEDCLATLRAMRDMGVAITRDGETAVTIEGVGLDGLKKPSAPLDLGNSGTAMRLLAGVLAAQRFDSTLIGDASLSRRPMARIIDPLTAMGAVIESDCDGTPPLEIRGGLQLRGIDYTMPVASAQVKSCVLLAGLYAEGRTSVTEPAVTRDHTERMLTAMGVDVQRDGPRASITGGQRLEPLSLTVPADLSSAAFVMLAATIGSVSDVTIHGVGVNPTRTGVIDILRSMGADIALDNVTRHAEPTADIRVRAAQLFGCDVDPALVPLAIDEFPALFVAAAVAQGVTRFSGLGELRVKESDRIDAMATGLRALGVRVDESDDGAIVHGGQLSGGVVESFGDHRIAMAFAIAGSVATQPLLVRGVDNVETSFPGFSDVMRDIGIDIRTESSA
ncbi:MAG: 3-phosphoshikimate 1-carboxyvinyltransferase [Woeseiaceae bacterium]|nr:3-phosphoshikimate 1-carboxyvinyltransferase [Woeseiaceae bacterium]